MPLQYIILWGVGFDIQLLLSYNSKSLLPDKNYVKKQR